MWPLIGGAGAVLVGIAAALLGELVVGGLFELLFAGLNRLPLPRRVSGSLLAGWWMFTAAAAWLATWWFTRNPASGVRAGLGMATWVALPAAGIALAMQHRHDARSSRLAEIARTGYGASPGGRRQVRG